MPEIGHEIIEQEKDESKRRNLECAKRVYAGDKPEFDLYWKLQEYFKKDGDLVAVFHGIKLYEIDITQEKDSNIKLNEKDFIILNCTKRYIMVVECKNSIGPANSVESSLNQLSGAKNSLELWFGADIDNSWHFIPMIFCQKIAIENVHHDHIMQGT